MSSTSEIDFNLVEPGDIRPTMQRCAVGSQGRSVVEAHIAPLRKLAKRLKTNDCSLQNTKYLATGFEDFVIILLEPSDKEEEELYEDILSDTDSSYPCAIQLLDRALKLASKGQRCVDNTIILDVRPLRSRKTRSREDKETRRQNDQMAYHALKEVLSLLHPKVIVVCHCDAECIEDGMPPYLCSSVKDAGEAFFLRMDHGHDTVRVSSFHPMFFARTKIEDSPKREMREYLFDLTLIVAANALAGRQVIGFGLNNIRHCALHGSFRRVSAKNMVLPELMEKFFNLSLRPDLKEDQLRKLIESYQGSTKQAPARLPGRDKSP